MEWNCPMTLGGLTFNQAGVTTYWLNADRCSGLDGAPIRSTVDNAPLTDGGLIHTSFRGPRPITIAGEFIVHGWTTEEEFAEARTDLSDALEAGLEAIRNADGTLSWTPSGKSARSITVRHDSAFDTSGGIGGAPKTFIFGLVAANPTITT